MARETHVSRTSGCRMCTNVLTRRLGCSQTPGGETAEGTNVLLAVGAKQHDADLSDFSKHIRSTGNQT